MIVKQKNFDVFIGFTIGVALALAIVSVIIFISEVIVEIKEVHEIVTKLEVVQ